MENKEIIKSHFRGKYDQFYGQYSETPLKRIGQKNEYQTLCKFHDDRNPSFMINADTGEYYCHGCGEKGHAFNFFSKIKGLDIRQDFPKILKGIAEDFSISLNENQSRFVEAYDYTDEAGNLLFQVCRYEPKRFQQRRRDAAGNWVYSLNGVRRVLYNLPEVLKAQEVIIVEGEKDVETLRSMGFTATTSSCGAGKWRSEYSESLRDKYVVLIPDNDQPGRDHMNMIASELQGIARSIKIVDLSDLQDKGDVSDWVKRFDTKEEAAERLSIMIESANPYISPVTKSDNPVESPPKDSRESIIDKFNSNYAVAMIGGKFTILHEIQNLVFNRPDVEFWDKESFRAFHKNKTVSVMVDKKVKEISEADIWLNSPDRREYKGVVFEPGKKEIPEYYNLYRGLGIAPKQGDWSLMKTHIREVIASGHNEINDYILAWMARIVQDPGGERPGVAIVLRGKQGTGKGVFATNFGAIFGNHFLPITQPSLVTGRFNAHLKDALVVFIDEGFWTGDKRAEGVLKGWVTEKEIVCEPKGRDAFSIKNHMNFIMASNNDWVVPAGFEERRFFTIDISDKHMKDTAYFYALLNQMDKGGREAMLYDLLNLDISDCDLRNFPRTEALLDQMTHSMSPVEKFWYEGLRAGQIDENTGWPLHIQTSELYKKFLEFSKNLGERFHIPGSEFGKKLKDLCEPLDKKRLTAGVRQVNHYIIPPIEECRKHFEMKVGMQINWNEN